MKTFAATALAAIAMAAKIQQKDATTGGDVDPVMEAGMSLYHCIDVNNDGAVSFREIVDALYTGRKEGVIPADVVKSFRANVYIHPAQFFGGVYGALETHYVPIEEWVPIVEDTAAQLEQQVVTGKGFKWFDKQLDASIQLAQTKGFTALGFSEDAEKAVAAFEGAVESLWNACDKNGNGKMQATELLYCLNQGHRDEVYDSSVSQAIFENIRVGPQLAELALVQTLVGAGIPEDEWAQGLGGAAEACWKGREAGML